MNLPAQFPPEPGHSRAGRLSLLTECVESQSIDKMEGPVVTSIVVAPSLVPQKAGLRVKTDRRFKTARQFMAFLGLVPSEQSSGNSVRRGSVTKTGNGHVWRILLEAAQHYRHRPVLSAALRKRQEGISKEVLEISWEALQRLCSRLIHFAKINHVTYHCPKSFTIFSNDA